MTSHKEFASFIIGKNVSPQFIDIFSGLFDQAMVWSDAHIKWLGKFMPKQEAKDVQ